jgi:hypothetical protein
MYCVFVEQDIKVVELQKFGGDNIVNLSEILFIILLISVLIIKPQSFFGLF